MMIRLAVVGVVAVSLACGGMSSSPVSEPPVTSSASEGASAERLELVEQVYSEYQAGHPPGLGALPWSAETAAAFAALDEMGLGSDPLIGGQDFDIADVQVNSQDDGTVEATFTNFDQPMRVVFFFVEEGGMQRVDNVEGPDGSLKELLASP